MRLPASILTIFLGLLSTASLAGNVYIADPYILEHEGVFYAYGTGETDGIPVYRSKDLKHWEGPCGKAEDGLALSKSDSWGETNYWAPEVYSIGGKFVMVYSADIHICVAFSDSPLGPFRQKEPKRPYIEDQVGIDSDIFIDDDGQAYMYWVRFDLGKGNEIRVARLSDDLCTIDEHQVECLASEPGTWEVVQEGVRVSEGPFVVKHKGLYYLSYSCNDYQSKEYAVGYATSSSPLGPWTRYEGNPVILHHGGYDGTGHHSFLTTSKGKMYMVFHAHKDSDNIHPRKMLLSRCRFVRSRNGGPDRIKVSRRVIVPSVD